MSTLETRAEIAKLARLLATEARGLAFLEKAAPADVRELREQATDALFDADDGTLQRVATASGKLPSPLVASIGQHAFGPLLCARVAGLLDHTRALDLARRLPSEFLAEVALHLDPRRASEVIGGMPAAKVVEVAAELERRGELVAMGRFVAHLDEAALRACLAALADATVLRVAFVLEGKERLDKVLSLLPEGRLGGVIRAAADAGLWPEALELLNHVGKRRRAQIARLAAQDDEVVGSLVRAACELDLWEDVLPLVGLMGAAGRRRLATVPAVQDGAVLGAIVHAATADGLWTELVPLVPLLPLESQLAVAEHAGALEPELLERLAEQARELGLLEQLGPLGEALDGG